MSEKCICLIGAIGSALAVILGAFGAHGLSSYLNPHNKEIWQTAAHYQTFHSLALLVLPLLFDHLARTKSPTSTLHPASLKRIAWAFTLGMLLFSGSLYTLALTQIHWLGAITPIGGTLLILGWLYLATVILKT